MSKHTPGPWTIRSIPGHLFELRDAHNDPILKIRGGMLPILADSRLIAAAPEMLEALSRLVKAINVPTPDPLIVMATIEQAKAAITKAEGK